MADLAVKLLRTITRSFYTTEHVLLVDALIYHSTLSDTDLAHVLGMQVKALRKICGRLKEDGLVSSHTRTERRTDGSGGFFGSGPGQAGKERVTHRDWYYLNFHRAIDTVKYRLLRLSRYVESLGAPTTEKKDLVCAQCKSTYTELEAMDNIDMATGNFICKRCGQILDTVDEEDRANENESVKRFNNQVEKIRDLMMQIDAATVPENDFENALAKQVPVVRGEQHPASRTEIVDNPNHNLQSSKGMALAPEKIAVQVQDDETVRKEAEEAEARAKREKEARQNALPEWISKSTVSGDITAVGAKEDRLRAEREAHYNDGAVNEEGDEKKADKGDEDVMDAYWKEMEAQRQLEAAQAKAEDEEDEEDDDEDDFEDVDVTGGSALTANGVKPAGSTGVSTPAVESSNATDDERETKRARYNGPGPSSGVPDSLMSGENGTENSTPAVIEGTPAASDEDEDDGLEFENV